MEVGSSVVLIELLLAIELQCCRFPAVPDECKDWVMHVSLKTGKDSTLMGSDTAEHYGKMTDEIEHSLEVCT